MIFQVTAICLPSTVYYIHAIMNRHLYTYASYTIISHVLQVSLVIASWLMTKATGHTLRKKPTSFDAIF